MTRVSLVGLTQPSAATGCHSANELVGWVYKKEHVREDRSELLATAIGIGGVALFVVALAVLPWSTL